MQNILLTSGEFVRTQTNISDNMQDKFLLPAIRESQDIDFQELTGTKLYKKLQDLVSGGTISDSENSIYKGLLDIAQYFLAYDTVARLCVISSFKLNNIGVNTTSDENVQIPTTNDIFKIEKYYINKKDFYAKRVQDYLLEYHIQLPELTQANYYNMQSNTYSSASCNMNLGGARARGRYWRNKHIGWDKD